MQLEILTPEKKLYSGEVFGVQLPGVSGLFEILDKHAPLVSALGSGNVKVLKDKTATEAAPAIQAYKLSYEPLLYITDAKGVQVDRLDAIFDAKELRETLAAAGIS